MGNNNKLGVITSKFVYVHTSVEIEFMTTTSLELNEGLKVFAMLERIKIPTCIFLPIQY